MSRANYHSQDGQRGLMQQQQARLHPNNYPTNMSGSGYQEGPKLGATFYPGGQDDFYMPELISPSPQRVMPEVPTNMQEGIAHLELEATETRNRDQRTSSIVSNPDQYSNPYDSSYSRGPAMSVQSSTAGPAGPAGYNASYEHTNASAYQNLYKSAPTQPEYKSYTTAKAAGTAGASPFPKLRDAGPNVPPSDEEKEEVLERARPLVLNSNDPEMQLAWAQDALLWVETAESSRVRLADDSTGRPSTPKVEHQLRVDSISIVNFLADQTHPKALFLKATWHEFGKFGYPLDRKEAFVGYRRAAEKGYARAEYRIGTQYESMQDMAKAIKHYNIGVSMGDSASSYRLGMMSLLGQHGQAQDYQLGMQRIRFAAETADENAPQGAYVYGMLLARELPNITVPESVLAVDIEQARTFIEKAAYLGFAKAQLKMGAAYELCLLGCDFNPALSLHYNALAARQNEPEADMAISKWFLCGFDGIFDKNEELAFKYAKRAAESESATAEFAMGYFYEIGVYVPADLGQAQSWYQKAADHGNKDAVGRLEGLSQQKTLSKQDHEQIAITRIKSQYGSKRGGRPDRLKEKRAPLPAMTEETVERLDMPSHTANRQSRSGSANAFMVVPPGINQMNPDVNYPPQRPRSAAPYPVDDHEEHRGGYNTNLQLRPREGPQADRPMSAFGIRPLVGPSQQGYGQDLTRPSTSAPDGRGNNSGGRQSVVSAGWDPQVPSSNYRQPSPGRAPQIAVAPIGHDRQPSIDNQGGRTRLSKAPPSGFNTGKPQPSLPPNSNVYPPDASRKALPLPSQQPGYIRGSSPNPNPYDNRGSTYSQGQRYSTFSNDTRNSTYPNDPRNSTYSNDNRASGYPNQDKNNLHNSSRPDRTDSTPLNAGPRPQPTETQSQSSASSRPPRTTSATPSMQSLPATPSPHPRPASSTQPAKPMKEGPKTFDEMGIPSQKNESDCIVM